VIADPHLGNLHSDEKTLKRIVADIAADPHCYWIGLGDYAEFINMRDPRFDPSELVDWLLGRTALKSIARAECARFLEIVEPISSRCLALIEGNHEAAILQHSEVDVYSILLEGIAMGDPDHDHRLDHRGMVSWVFERQGGHRWALRIYATHGSGGGRTSGAVSNRLAELAGQVDGVDIIMQGHSHKPGHLPLEKFRPSHGRESEQVCIHTVSAPSLCRDMRYAESKDMRAIPIGYCQFVITPETHGIAFSMDVK
jgi:hypothetical protein